MRHFGIVWAQRSPPGPAKQTGFFMSHVTYKIVEHDGGWAYTVNGVFSEAFATHGAALAAAKRAAAEQRVPGRPEEIQYETSDGKWHTETAAGTVPRPMSRTRRKQISVRRTRTLTC